MATRKEIRMDFDCPALPLRPKICLRLPCIDIHLSTSIIRTVCLVAAFVGPLCASAASAGSRASPIGINLNGVKYYTPEQPFIDIFKTAHMATAGGWLTQNTRTYAWDTGEQDLLQLDANGWVTSLAGKDGRQVSFNAIAVLVLRNLGSPYYPSGQYIVLYDGEGDLRYSLDAVKVASAPGRDVLLASKPSNEGILIQIAATDPRKKGNYIRNIRVIRAEHEALFQSGAIFNPTFIDRIAPFGSIRFMDWMNTNLNTKATAWSERPKPTDAFWSGPAGVPLEIMVSLANQLRADVWFNMPLAATDDYVIGFAAYVHRNLGSGQRAYLEYFNEFWNGLTPGAAWMQAEGHTVWPSAPVDFEITANYYGMRTAQVCDGWKETWGVDAARVTCVMGQQTFNSGVASLALACKLWAHKPCAGNHG